jgi:hypothetical protein
MFSPNFFQLVKSVIPRITKEEVDSIGVQYVEWYRLNKNNITAYDNIEEYIKYTVEEDYKKMPDIGKQYKIEERKAAWGRFINTIHTYHMKKYIIKVYTEKNIYLKTLIIFLIRYV